jgi:hypothetical protein
MQKVILHLVIYNYKATSTNEPNKKCDNLLTSISLLQDFKFKFSRKINVTDATAKFLYMQMIVINP